MRLAIYTTRTAVVSPTVTLIGTAYAGSSESDPVWRIIQLTDDGAGNLATRYSNGSTAFSCIWTDRNSYTYL